MNHNTRVLLHRTWRYPTALLATGMGIGLLPLAPGTFGTLLAVPLYLLLRPLPLWWYGGIVIVMFVVGIWISGRTAVIFEADDHPAIVWDEIVGFLVTMLLAPQGWIWVATGFGFFRLFDVWKPFPIRWLEQRVPGGLGIMVDDLLAGGYALIALEFAQLIAQIQMDGV
jgi:phosphatidylglycerophosphatase A